MPQSAAARAPGKRPLAGEMGAHPLAGERDVDAQPRASAAAISIARDVVRRRDDPLGQSEADREILEVAGRRHHHREGRAAEQRC